MSWSRSVAYPRKFCWMDRLVFRATAKWIGSIIKCSTPYTHVAPHLPPWGRKKRRIFQLILREITLPCPFLLTVTTFTMYRALKSVLILFYWMELEVRKVCPYSQTRRHHHKPENNNNLFGMRGVRVLWSSFKTCLTRDALKASLLLLFKEEDERGELRNETHSWPSPVREWAGLECKKRPWFRNEITLVCSQCMGGLLCLKLSISFCPDRVIKALDRLGF